MADLASELGGAVERGEITAWFQPQLDLKDGAGFVGAEALCRWMHPTRGMIPPAEFIPLAEQTGEIDTIGRHMTEQCWAALRFWQSMGQRLDVSVNVSPAQLHDAWFTSWLNEHVDEESRAVLTLEITESLPLEDVAALVPRLDHLRELGFGIAIDDFGIGQASLTQLWRLHCTELKIDRSLIVDASDETTRRLAEVVRVAHRSGIRVVAEGVETYAQLARVRELGCDRAQGYLIAKPMPRVELDQLLLAA